MKRQLGQFIVRVLVNALGIFIASQFLSGVTYQDRWQVLISAALILSVINVLIKPLIIIFSLPALLLTLGLFTVMINGFMVYLAHLLYRPFQVSNFKTAVLAGLVVGLVNYILTRVFDTQGDDSEHTR